MAQNSQIVEKVLIDGKNYHVIWHDAQFSPPRDLTVQASGICFTPQGRIVLVSSNDESWTLPGGHPEKEETLEESFKREIREEACAIVTQCAYIGCQEVQEMDGDRIIDLHYSARFSARVELEPFRPEFEIVHRKCIPPSEFIRTLNWSTIRCAKAILEAGLREEEIFSRSPNP